MWIDYQNNILIVNYSNIILKPRVISQFSYWGFVKEHNTFILRQNIPKVLPKIVQYFKKKGIPFKLSEESQNLIKVIFIEKENFQKLLDKGQKFKDGLIDNKEFGKFLEFIKKNIKRKLKNHQVKASYHLYLLGNGANFSVPGSGKTTTVLTVYEKLKQDNKVNTLFVIGPPACFGPWKSEFGEVLGRKPKYSILAGGTSTTRKLEYIKYQNNSELYLTTFQTLLNDQNEVCSFLKSKNVKAFLVVDEAHYIKQVNGNWANAVLKVAEYAVYRCILTGTPLPNSYTDLFNIFDFLWPDNIPINIENKTKLIILEKNKDYQSAQEILDPVIGPLFYRVRKSELGLKPQKFHSPNLIQMNKYERIVYDAIINKIRNYSKDDYLKNIDFVNNLRRGRMMRLRQSLSYTYLLSTTIKDYNEDLIKDDTSLKYIIYKYSELELPAKLTYLINLIENLMQNKEKVVVWSTFIGTIKLIEKKLLDLGHKCNKIIGETPFEKATIQQEITREKIRNEFVDKDSGLNILLANPAACAESISLHQSCHHAVYYDLSYNCAQYLQSLDRIHRVGGSEKITAHYHYLHYKDTIDSEILGSLERKAQKMYNIIEGDYSIYSMDMFEENDELEAYKRLFL
ncbi:MAG: DEAD/DEAH box helicase [Patescibacteria group bacterium]